MIFLNENENVTERASGLEAMLENSGEGALHLAENEAVTHYDEGPAEKLERWLKKYEKHAEGGTDNLGTWLANVSKQKNSKLGLMLNCTETREYLQDLSEFSPHFMVDEIYSQGFCLDFLHGVNGAVSGSFSALPLEKFIH